MLEENSRPYVRGFKGCLRAIKGFIQAGLTAEEALHATEKELIQSEIKRLKELKK